MSEQGKVHSEKETFGKLFEKLMHNKSITDGACRLYGHMHWRYGSNKDNHEGRASMAEFMGVSEATITNRIGELEAHDWVVTILRGRHQRSGNWQSAFYHVFEDQKQCRKFREAYVVADGEEMRQKPEKVRTRKSRKGVGGNPKFTAPTQVEPDNQHNSSFVGGQNSSSVRADNLSFDNPDSSDPDSVDLDSNIASDAAPAVSPAPPDKPKRTRKSTAPKPRSEYEQPDVLYEAVERFVFEIEGTPDMPYEWKGHCGYTTKWLRGEIARWGEHEFGKISAPALPEHVERFIRWYREERKGTPLPTNPATFVKNWRQWATAIKAQSNGHTPKPTQQGKPDNWTPEDDARVAAQYAESNRRLEEWKRQQKREGNTTP